MGALLWVTAFATTLAVSWALVLGIRLSASRLNLIDVPNSRSLHSTPTPRGGGLAVVLVGLAGAVIGLGLGASLDWRRTTGYFLGASLIIVVGLIDDLRALPTLPKLAVQVVAATCLVAGLAPQLFSLDPWLPAWIGLAVAGLVTVALTNIYNFMDGSDGLAATQGVLAGLGWTVLAISNGHVDLAVLALLVAGGCLGFLAHNLPPASIFMGDVGSAFLGFTFAFLPLAIAHDAGQLFAGVLMIWPFAFDATLTIGRRIARRQNITRAHREHLYQRLILAGWSPMSVMVLYGLFCLLSVGLAVVWWRSADTVRGLVLVVIVLCSAALWRLVTRAELLAIKRSAAVH
jgi:UDP-N-acetylmuramyl pentapeptide phosphotransferase/UDP-N-acetylglucosamine-1-phosphate transferase